MNYDSPGLNFTICQFDYSAAALFFTFFDALNFLPAVKPAAATAIKNMNLPRYVANAVSITIRLLCSKFNT